MSASSGLKVTGSLIPRLARGVRLHNDPVRGRKVLLAPERALALDEIAVKIIEALDGDRSIDSISTDLARQFGAPRDRVAADIITFLQELADRRMLETSS